MRDPSKPAAHPTAPMRAMILYDAIIDDIFCNPTTKITETAARLKRNPSTISLVVRSDFFRARWLQRREQYNEDLNFRLHNKMTSVLERSLDATNTALKERTNIPLPILDSINKTLLDRLGYAPNSPPGGPAVVIQNNTTAGATAIANGQASPEGLEAARKYLQMLESVNAGSGARPGNALAPDHGASVSPVVEGEFVREPSNASST